MTFTREEHEKLLERRLRESGEQRRPQLERDLRAGAAAENLTGTPEWDFYLNKLEEISAEAREVVSHCDTVLLGPEVKQDMLLGAKVARAGAMGMLAALERASALPKQIVEQAKQSKKVLSG
jgi:hypothetical protein